MPASRAKSSLVDATMMQAASAMSTTSANRDAGEQGEVELDTQQQ
jgi:hypothetical protein